MKYRDLHMAFPSIGGRNIDIALADKKCVLQPAKKTYYKMAISDEYVLRTRKET